MARIHDLIRQVAAQSPDLAGELEREVAVLSERRAFGLNFERHTPEEVELPGRPVRRGDKVHILPPRGETPKVANAVMWVVESLDRDAGSATIARGDVKGVTESKEVALDDLVVVAEFRDPIYPGLVSTGRVERGGDKPYHSVINGENFHALQTLLFTHRGKVDVIYIDPPYNTGARDWKYNNDYVESDDMYRHSKWLAFMERRLLLAKELLNPKDSVLIVTIDEKEYLRLGLLLEQVFEDARMTMISSVINSKGVARKGTFSRTDEYIFFVQLGASRLAPLPLSEAWRIVVDKRASTIQWILLNRSGTNSRRIDRPKLFYPIFIRNTQDGPVFDSVGEPIGDADRTVYFVLDEAHRGFNAKTSTERGTIVRRLVAGDQTGYGMPIVLGISATIGRFKQAMDVADESDKRRALPDVTVEPSRVQASGLVKDTVVLDIPGEAGDFGTTLVTEAAKRLKQSTLRWKRYAVQQSDVDAVVPLLVFQIPNTPDPDEVGSALDAIHAVISDLTAESVRHVLTGGKTETFGRWEVDGIEPQRVQETTDVRVLVAKEAISTGWDCPRAEVLVSLRPAKDQTHIAQLLGRMIRSPLARRVPGDDRLNAVDCILPYFDRTTAGNVVRYMTGQLDELPPIAAGRVLMGGRELEVNPEIDAEVWDVFDALPTQAVPQRGSKPVKRLVALAQALSVDGLRTGALAEATKKLHDWLDGYATVHADEVAEAVAEIRAVHIETLTGRSGETGVTYATRTVAADDRAIRSGLDEAKRVFGADVAQDYVNHLVDSSDEDDEDLRDAYVRTAALATVRPLREKVDRDADELVDTWFAEHRVAIRSLTDDRQQEYEDIRSIATEPQTGELRRPRNRMEDFAVLLDGDVVGDAPLMKKHLMSDAHGDFPIGTLNSWEREIVESELARPDSAGWYRNPSHNGVDSVTVAYRDPIGDWRSMHPDFVFFNRIGGVVRPSIVDPHGQHLEDSLVKLQGLAKYAERYGEVFHRIEATLKDGGTWRVLDLKRAEVRAKVASHTASVLELYKGPGSP